jgi:uncharacterized protein YjiS (DUF1127 family)
MTHITQSISFLSEYIYRAVTWIEDVAREYRKAKAKSETISELSRLSDKELRDIGLTRGEIHDVAQRTYENA